MRSRLSRLLVRGEVLSVFDCLGFKWEDVMSRYPRVVLCGVCLNGVEVSLWPRVIGDDC